MDDANPRTRLDRRKEQVRHRQRTRARHAAFGAGAVGMVMVGGMLAAAFVTPHALVNAADAAKTEADHAPESSAAGSTPSSSTAPSSAATSSSATSELLALTSATSSSSEADHPSSPTPAPTLETAAQPLPSATSNPPASTVDTKAPAAKPNAQPFGGTPAVGVLFASDHGSVQDHYCTASVVHSPAGNLVVTAAHCVFSDGAKSDIAFAPGYHDGQTPYGVWTATKVIVSDAWQSSGNVDQDVAFLVMAPSSSGASIESVAGANQIAFGTGFGQAVTVPAYPQGNDTPVTCEDTTSEFSSTQTEWDCGGYPDGTSGAPFLTSVDGSGEKGTVVGVIGGYQQGGLTPEISYSSYFGPAVQSLYQNAINAAS